MRVIPLLFILFVFFSISTMAQSKESKGCGKEKECVVKSCEENESNADVMIEEKHHVQKSEVVREEQSDKKKDEAEVTKKKIVIKKEE